MNPLHEYPYIDPSPYSPTIVGWQTDGILFLQLEGNPIFEEFPYWVGYLDNLPEPTQVTTHPYYPGLKVAACPTTQLPSLVRPWIGRWDHPIKRPQYATGAVKMNSSLSEWSGFNYKRTLADQHPLSGPDYYTHLGGPVGSEGEEE